MIYFILCKIYLAIQLLKFLLSKSFLFTAVSCFFSLSFNLVGLYLELFIAPINSVHMGILQTKFHQKKWKLFFFDRKTIKLGKRRLGMSQTQLKRVSWLIEGKFSQLFWNLLFHLKIRKFEWVMYDCFFLYVWHFVVWNLYLVTSKCNSCKMYL